MLNDCCNVGTYTLLTMNETVRSPKGVVCCTQKCFNLRSAPLGRSILRKMGHKLCLSVVKTIGLREWETLE